MKIELTDAEKLRFEQWIKENVTARKAVPSDEGNDEALVYNLVHLIRGDNQKYNYEPDQIAEIEAWNIQ